MKQWMSLAFVALFTSSTFAYDSSVVEEKLYYDYQKSILKQTVDKTVQGFAPFDQALYVDALEDLLAENSPEALRALLITQDFHYALSEKLRLGILKMKYQQAPGLSPELVIELENALRTPEPDLKIIYLVAAYEELLISKNHSSLVDLAGSYAEYGNVSKNPDLKKTVSDEIVADLFFNSPDLSTFSKGQYAHGVKLFMFCRQNRLYPCVMVMRDSNGEVVRNEDGSIWTHRALASAKSGDPSYIRNGNTPAGIMTIDSVMPHADQQISFGKFRRLILNFVPKTRQDQLLMSLLPESSLTEGWWKQGVVARDIGRNLFRIHGTGKLNRNYDSPFWPFMQTAGCVAQRENTYGSETFMDQRKLLDKMMEAMRLTPNYANEAQIKGVFYFMELDGQNAPVTARDLMLRGIE